jgi:hypothetical protein
MTVRREIAKVHRETGEGFMTKAMRERYRFVKMEAYSITMRQ